MIYNQCIFNAKYKATRQEIGFWSGYKYSLEKSVPKYTWLSIWQLPLVGSTVSNVIIGFSAIQVAWQVFRMMKLLSVQKSTSDS